MHTRLLASASIVAATLLPPPAQARTTQPTCPNVGYTVTLPHTWRPIAADCRVAHLYQSADGDSVFGAAAYPKRPLSTANVEGYIQGALLPFGSALGPVTFGTRLVYRRLFVTGVNRVVIGDGTRATVECMAVYAYGTLYSFTLALPDEAPDLGQDVRDVGAALRSVRITG